MRIASIVGTIVLAGCLGCNTAPPSSNPPPRVDRAQLTEMLAAGEAELIVEHGELRDDDFALLKNSPQLTRVEIRENATPLGDAALAHLESLPHLEWINLPGENVTDAGLASAAKHPKLRILNLHATKVTDRGLASLVPLANLELLRLGSPHVTDGGIEQIAAIKSLRFLHLIDVPITDAGLRPIASLPQLESFYLDGGQATDEGLSALLKARPNLHFHYNEEHLPGDPRRASHSHGHDHGHSHEWQSPNDK